MRFEILKLNATLLVAALLTACSGGGDSGSSIPVSAAAPVPVVADTPTIVKMGPITGFGISARRTSLLL